jgi:antirestriction protein
MASITLYELSQYNNGILHPFVIDLDPLSIREEYLEAIQEELNSMIDTDEDSDGNRPLYEEWIVCCSEDVPHAYVGEYDLWDDYWELKEAMDDNPHIPEAAFFAGVSLDIPPASIPEAYQGTYDSDEDFAADLAESCGYLNAMPENLRYYFDYEKFARDLMIGDYVEDSGHYFSRNY